MNSRERVLCALAGQQPDRVPFCETFEAPNVARQLTTDNHIPGQREISDLIGRDNVLAVVYPPFFADRVTNDDGQTFYTTGWIKSRQDLERMVFRSPDDPDLYANAQQILDEKGDYAAGVAFKLGVSAMLISMGLETFCYALKDDRWLIEQVLRRYEDWQLQVSQHLMGMGFDFVWTTDDVAFQSGPFVSPPLFRELLLPSLKRSAEAITLPWIYHSDGNLMPIMDDLLTLGMDAIHPIEPEAMDLAQVKARYGQRVCLVGNVSVDLLSRGTPDQVRERVRKCIAIAGRGGGYMAAASNSITPYARPENVLALGKAIHEFGAYPLPDHLFA